MYALGLDTAQDYVGAALLRDAAVVGEIAYRAPLRQLRYLMSMVTDLLARCEIEATQLGLVGFTAGPGAFTGLRLGLVTARTLAQVLAIPVIGVDTLDVIAAGCALRDGVLVVASDARRREVFSAVYRFSEGARSTLRAVRASSAAELAAEMAELAEAQRPSRVLVAGNALERYGDILLERRQLVAALDPELWHPRASRAALLALARLEEGAGGSFLEAEAAYFRPPDIQVDPKMKLREPAPGGGEEGR